MSLPPNIRVNVGVPFPAMVTGSGPITLGKTNGVWTVGLSYLPFAVSGPTVGTLANQFVLVYDQVQQVFLRFPLNVLGLAAGARLQRSVTASPIVVSAIDQILNVNINAGLPACTLPQAATRNGVPVTFKDVGGQFGAHPLTITAFAGDTIDGAATLVLNVPRQGVTLVPFNDSVNTGWAIE